MTMSSIESVIAAAEAQAVIDWEVEHREPQPCRHERVLVRQRLCSRDELRSCADCGKPLPSDAACVA